MNLNAHTARIAHQASSTSILPVRHCGIGILPMIHGLEAHATKSRLLTYPLGAHYKPGHCHGQFKKWR